MLIQPRRKLWLPTWGMRPLDFAMDPEQPLTVGNQLLLGGLQAGGKYAHDSSPFGRDGALTGLDLATCWGLDISRSFLTLDGSNDYVTGSLPVSFFALSYSIWIRPHTYPSNGTSSVCLSRGGVTNPPTTYPDFWMEQYGPETGNLMYLYFGSGTPYAGTAFSPALNTWTHVGVSNSGSGWAVYINGVPIGTGAGGALTNSWSIFTVGKPFASSGYGSIYWDGDTADQCIWNRVLTPSEFQLLASPDPMLGGWFYDPTSVSVSFAGTSGETNGPMAAAGAWPWSLSAPLDADGQIAGAGTWTFSAAVPLDADGQIAVAAAWAWTAAAALDADGQIAAAGTWTWTTTADGSLLGELAAAATWDWAAAGTLGADGQITAAATWAWSLAAELDADGQIAAAAGWVWTLRGRAINAELTVVDTIAITASLDPELSGRCSLGTGVAIAAQLDTILSGSTER